MQINVAVTDANNIVCQVVPPQTEVITIDRGVAGNGIVSIVPVTISTFQYLRITYTNGTVQDVGPLTSTAYTATSPITIVGNTISLATVPIASGGTDATTAAGAIQNLLPSYTGNANKRLGLNSGGTGLEWVADGGGTVTSIAASGGSTGLTFSGSPITSSGTLTLGGTLAVASGGTGATTAGDALTNLGAIGAITSTDGSVTITSTGTSRDLSVAVAAATNNVIAQVRNTTGATLTKGTVVYISGATGQLPTVSKAIATGDSTSAQTLGMMTADLANNSNGNVTIIGLITNIDTSAYTDGAQLYLSGTTAGAVTATKPSAPIHLVYVAVVEYAHPTQGKLFVKVQNGYELDEIHDVSIVSPVTGQTLVYNSTTDLWVNNTVSLTAGVNGTLPVANGGTGVTTSTGTGSVVLSTSPTLVTPLLGTPTSGNFSTGTFTWPTFNQNTTGTAANVTGVVAIANGGTGQTTANAALNALLPTQTGNASKYLQTDGTNATWDAISLSTADITGILPTANGGTGLSSFTANGVVYASSTSALTTGAVLKFDGSAFTLNPAQIFVRANSAKEYLRLGTDGSNDIYLGGSELLTITGGVGIRFNTGTGSEQMRMTTTGLGIGTSSINQKLTVANNVGIVGANSDTLTSGSYLYLRGDGGSGSGQGVIAQINAVYGLDLWGYNSGWQKNLTLTASGNLGIGTSSPAAKVHSSLSSSGATSETLRLDNPSDSANAGTKLVYRISGWSFDGGFASLTRDGSGGGTIMAFGTSANASTTNASEKLRIDSAGNVGIGTTSPSARLDVVSASTGVAEFNGPANASVTFTGSGFVEGKIQCGGELNFGSTNNYPVAFLTNGAERVRITSGGSLGIGTSAPAGKLQVNALSGTPLLYVNGTTYSFDISSGIVLTESNTSAQTGINSLMLANNTYSVGAYSPILSFSSRSSSGSYNNVYAGIYGVLTGEGVDTNWVRGDLVLATDQGAGITERVRIKGSGSSTDGFVGIGTSSPSAKLHVSNGTTTNAIASNAVAGFTSSANSVLSFNVPDANAAGLFFGYGGNAYWAGIEKSGSTGLRLVSGGIVQFDTNGSEKARIDGSGNFMIGTTTIGAGNRMNVVGNNVVFSPNTAGKDTHTFSTGAADVGTYAIKSNTTTTIYLNAGGKSYINSGNVGIGQTNPASALEIANSASSTFSSFNGQFQRGTSNTAFNLLSISNLSTNCTVGIYCRIVATSPVTNDACVIELWGAASRQSGGSVTYTTVAPAVAKAIVGANISAGSLSWSGSTLQYTTNASTNYVIYHCQFQVTAADSATVTFFP